MSLPSGYTRLEYIKSTGTQKIDTGLLVEKSESWEMEFEWTPTAPSSATYVGGDCFLQIGMGTTGYGVYRTSNTKAYGTRDKMRIVFANQTETLYVNGAKVFSNSWASETITNVKLGLFALGITGNKWSSVYAAVSAKFYGCTIKKDGVLVRDFIPCKSSDGTIGLWDDVNSVFYGNAGTGVFAAGPEFHVTKLAYIRSSGTQFINSRVSAAGGIRVKTKFTLASWSSFKVLFGAYATADSCNYFGVTSSKEWEFRTTEKTNWGAPAASTLYDLDFCSIPGNVFCKIDNVSQDVGSAGAGSDIDLDVYLFALNRARAVNYYASADLWATEIYDSAGTLVRDLIPARMASGDLGMWDRLNKRFYSNAGTGVFVAGPDVHSRTLVDGIGYDVNSGRCLVGGIGYDILSGRTLRGGIGYDISFNKDASLTWVLNDTLSGPAITADVEFISKNTRFVTIKCAAGKGAYTLQYLGTSSKGNVDAIDSRGRWEDTAYKTIVFAEPPTGDLLAWLMDNGTPQ